MMRDAPTNRAASTALMPTPPTPNTTRLWPVCMCIDCNTAPAPVMMPHPIGPSIPIDTVDGAFIALRSSTTEYSANDDWPKKLAFRGVPPCESGVVPSSLRPLKMRGNPWSQYGGKPRRQLGHTPHEL